ncbi:MAG: hypothetical protein WC222_06810 [Parachlamydiales bacterium]|jgi:hypothetical protein
MSITIVSAVSTISPIHQNPLISSSSPSAEAIPIVHKGKFHPVETPEDQEIANALPYLDETYSLKAEYLKPLPPEEALEEAEINLQSILNRTLKSTNNSKTISDFLKSQYEASIALGNPIKHFKIIGSTSPKAAGKTYVRELLIEVPSLLNANTEKRLDVLPKDLDIRAEFSKPVTQKQLFILNTAACAFIGKELKSSISEEEPNLLIKIPEDRIDYGLGYYKEDNFSLFRNSAFHFAITPTSLYEDKLHITPLSRYPNSHRRAFADLLLKIMYDDEAADKNYLALLGLIWGFLNGNKCYKRSMLTSYLFAHSNKFQDKKKWALNKSQDKNKWASNKSHDKKKWASKFAEYIHNHVISHSDITNEQSDNTSEIKFVLFLAFELICEREVNFQKGLKPYTQLAFKKLFSENTQASDPLFNARHSGIPASVIALMLNASIGLMLACPSMHNSKVHLTKIFDEPFLELIHDTGFKILLEWDPNALATSTERVHLFLDEYSPLLIDIFTSVFSLSIATESTIPVFSKYKERIVFEAEALLAKVQSWGKPENKILQLIALSLLMQLRALGVQKAEEILCMTILPHVMNANHPLIRETAIQVGKSLLLSVSPKHMHSVILGYLIQCTPQGWMLALAYSGDPQLSAFAFELWRVQLIEKPAFELRFICRMLFYYPETAIDELQTAVNQGTLDTTSLKYLSDKLRLLMTSASHKISCWCKLYDLCSHRTINVSFEEAPLRDNYLKAFIKLKKTFNSQNPQQLEESCRQGILLADEISKLGSKFPWKNEFASVVEIFKSRLFKQLVPSYLNYWRRLFILLDDETPEVISKRCLYALSEMATDWLSVTPIPSENNLEVYRVILKIIEKFTEIQPSAPKLYALLLKAQSHPLFKDVTAIDLLRNETIKFLQNVGNSFSLTPLLTPALKRDSNLINESNYVLFLEIARTLVTEDTLESLNLSTAIAKTLATLKAHTPASKEWSAFSNHLLLSARHRDDAKLHQENALLVYEELKTDCLLEALQIEASKNVTVANPTFISLYNRMKTFSTSQRELYISLALQQISANPNVYLEWFQTANATPSFSNCETFSLMLAFMEKIPDDPALHLLVVRAAQKQNIQKSAAKTDEYEPLLKIISLLLNGNNLIPWKFLTSIKHLFPNDKRITKHYEYNLSEALKNNDYNQLIVYLLDSNNETSSDESKIISLRTLWADFTFTHPKMPDLIKKYAPLLNGSDWDCLWKWVEHKGKKTLAVHTFAIWKTSSQPTSNQTIVALGLHAPSELISLFDSLKDLFKCLRAETTIPPDKRRNILCRLFQCTEASSEDFILEVLNEAGRYKFKPALQHSILQVLIPLAFQKNYQNVLIVCCAYILITVEKHPKYNKQSIDLLFDNATKWPKKLDAQLAIHLFKIFEKSKALYKQTVLAGFFPWIVQATFQNGDIQKAKEIQISFISSYCAKYIKEIPKILAPYVFNILEETAPLSAVINCPYIFPLLHKALGKSVQARLDSLWYNTLFDMLHSAHSHTDPFYDALMMHLIIYFNNHPLLFTEAFKLIQAAVEVTVSRILASRDFTQQIKIHTDFEITFSPFKDMPSHMNQLNNLFLDVLLSPKGFLTPSQYYNLNSGNAQDLDKKTLDALEQCYDLTGAQSQIAFIDYLFQLNLKYYNALKDNLDYISVLKDLLERLFFHPAMDDEKLCRRVIPIAVGILSLCLKNQLYPLNNEYHRLLSFFLNNLDTDSQEIRLTTFEENISSFWLTFHYLRKSHPACLSRSIHRLYYFAFRDFENTDVNTFSNVYTTICELLPNTCKPVAMSRLTKSLFYFLQIHPSHRTGINFTLGTNLLCLGFQKFAVLVSHNPPDTTLETEILFKEVEFFLNTINLNNPIEWPNFIEMTVEKIYAAIIEASPLSDNLLPIFSHFLNSIFASTMKYGTMEERKTSFRNIFTLANDTYLSIECSRLVHCSINHPSKVFANPRSLLDILPQSMHEHISSCIIENKPPPSCNSQILVQLLIPLESICKLREQQQTPANNSKIKELIENAMGYCLSINMYDPSYSNGFRYKLEVLVHLFLISLSDSGFNLRAKTFANVLFKRKVLSNPKVIVHHSTNKSYFVFKHIAELLVENSSGDASYYNQNVICSVVNTLTQNISIHFSSIYKPGSLSRYYWVNDPKFAFLLLLLETEIDQAHRYPANEKKHTAAAFSLFQKMLTHTPRHGKGLYLAYNILLMNFEIHRLGEDTNINKYKEMQSKIFNSKSVDKYSLLYCMSNLIFECNRIYNIKGITPNISFALLDWNSRSQKEIINEAGTAFVNIWTYTTARECWGNVYIHMCLLAGLQTYLYKADSPGLVEMYAYIFNTLLRMLDISDYIPHAACKGLFHFLDKQHIQIFKYDQLKQKLMKILSKLIQTKPKDREIEDRIELELLAILDICIETQVFKGIEDSHQLQNYFEYLLLNQISLLNTPGDIEPKLRGWMILTSFLWKETEDNNELYLDQNKQNACLKLWVESLMNGDGLALNLLKSFIDEPKLLTIAGISELKVKLDLKLKNAPLLDQDTQIIISMCKKLLHFTKNKLQVVPN